MDRSEALRFLAGYARQHFSAADTVLLCGSTAADRATPTSDLDLIVIFTTIPEGAWRETMDGGGALVEAFCHDLGTLRFFLDSARPSGVPILARMVDEGVAVPGFPGTLAPAAKAMAAAVLAEGPPALSQADLDHQRYTISSLVDDLADASDAGERLAIAAALHTLLATFALRAAGEFGGNGKGLARALRAHDPALADLTAAAFDELFRTGRNEPVRTAVEAILAPYGGRLVAGYMAQAPADWRK
jgi:hypothetical protein